MTNRIAESVRIFLEEKHQFIVVNEPVPYKAAVLRSYDTLEKVWYVEYYIFDEINEKLVRKRVSLSQDTSAARKKEAKYLISTINNQLRLGAVVNPKVPNPIQNPSETPVTITDKSTILAAIDYFLFYNRGVLRPRTLEVYTTDLLRFKKYLLENKLQKLRLRDFNINNAINFLDSIKILGKVSNRSVNNNKDTCSTLLNFFVKRKAIEENPFKQIKDLPSVAKRHTAFSKKQITAIKNECISQGEHQLLLFLEFIYYMALRPLHEARLLKVGDIKEKTVVVRSENAKDKTTEHVRIPKVFQKRIEESGIRNSPEHYFVFGKNDKPGREEVSRKHFYIKHFRILEKLKLTGQNLDTYGYKHSGVIALWQATQNIELIRQHCRHSDIATTQKYLRDLGQFIDYDEIDKFPEL